MPKTRRTVWIVIIVILIVIGAAATLLILRRGPRHERAFRRGMLQLQGRNPKEAMTSFRNALRMKSDFLDAQIGVIRTFTALKEFEKAFDEIENAISMGLSDSSAAGFRASVRQLRARYRIEAAGVTVTPQDCDDAIKNDIAPAMQELIAFAETADEPAEMYTLLARIHAQACDILVLKQRLLTNEREVALNLEEPEKAKALEKEITQADVGARLAQQSMLGAYHKALEKNPNWTDARVAIARHCLSTYVPQVEKTREYLAPVLQDTPEHAMALRLMAEAERLDGNHDQALEYVRALRKQQPNNLEFETFELWLLIDSERWDEVPPVANDLAAKLPNDPRVAYWHARWLLHQAKPEEAERLLQNSVLEDSGQRQGDVFWRPQACKLLADVLLLNNKREQAINAYKKALRELDTANVANIQIANELRELRFESNTALAQELAANDPKSAAAHARSAFEIYPSREDAYNAAKNAALAAGLEEDQILNLARIRIATIETTQGSDAAIEVCRSEMSRSNDSAPFRMMEAGILTRQGSYKKAVDVLQSLGHDYPDEPVYARTLALIYLQTRQNAKAVQVYRELYDSYPKDASIATALLILLAQEGRMDEARALLAEARDTLGPEKTRDALISIALLEKRPDEALLLAKEYVTSRPGNAEAQTLEAELLWQTGQLDEARAAFDKALALEPDHRAGLRLGLLDIQEGRFEEAIALFQTALDRHPEAPIYLAAALNANGQPDQAAKTLERLRLNRFGPDMRLDTARWILALILTNRGDVERAMSETQQIVSANMGYIADRQRLLGYLAELEPSARQEATTALSLFWVFATNRCPQAARKQLEQATKLLPKEPLPACWLALTFANEGKHDESVKLFKNIISENPDLTVAQLMLSETYAQEGALAQAASVLKDALRTASQDNVSSLHLRIGEIEEKLGKTESAIENYKLAMKHPLTEAQACNNAAWLLVTSKSNAAKALPYAQRALKLLPNSAAVHDTFGWVLFVNGDTQQAIQHLLRAKRIQPQNPTIRFHLANAYLKAKNMPEAKSELEEALAISEAFPEAKEAAKLLSEL